MLRVSLDRQRLVDRIRSLQQRLADLRPAYDTAAEVLADATDDRFARQGDGDWPPLAAATLRRRRRDGQGSRLLDRTGRLRRSLTNPDGPDAQVRIDRDGLRLSTRVPYARHVAARRDPLPPIDRRLRQRLAAGVEQHLLGDPR